MAATCRRLLITLLMPLQTCSCCPLYVVKAYVYLFAVFEHIDAVAFARLAHRLRFPFFVTIIFLFFWGLLQADFSAAIYETLQCCCCHGCLPARLRSVQCIYKRDIACLFKLTSSQTSVTKHDENHVRRRSQRQCCSSRRLFCVLPLRWLLHLHRRGDGDNESQLSLAYVCALHVFVITSAQRMHAATHWNARYVCKRTHSKDARTCKSKKIDLL